MAIDYGVDYQTILPGGRILLDLSPIRLTGPMIPVVRVARAWIEELNGAVEETYTRTEIALLAARLEVAGLAVDHVLKIIPLSVALGADKVLRVHGSIWVGGARQYPLNVSIDQLGQALAQVSV